MMRTVEEIHSRFLEEVRLAVERPTLYGGTEDVTEALLLKLLDDLCFVDGRQAEWDAARATYVKGCRWVRGHFEFQHRPFPTYVNEVASVYAEVAFALGYFVPKRQLSKDEMSALLAALDGGFFERDWTETDLHKRFGTPSHQVVGGETSVACYCGNGRGTKWVFFDLARRLPTSNESLAEPLLRNVRRDVMNRMQLLPFGSRWVSGAQPPSAVSTTDR